MIAATTDETRKQRATDQKIRRMAKRCGYVAIKFADGYGCILWRFRDRQNWLQSPESGLAEEDAIDWLNAK